MKYLSDTIYLYNFGYEIAFIFGIMKKLNLPTALSLILSISAIGLWVYQVMVKEGSEVRYINTPKLLNEYAGMKDARVEFQNTTKIQKLRLDTLRQELEQSMRNFELKRAELSPELLKEYEQTMQQKQLAYQQYQQNVQNNISEEEQRLNQRVMSDVNAFIQSYAKKHNKKLILGATSVGNLVYADDELDLTNELLTELNKTYLNAKK